ncbi:hypothetical protein BJ322DRAFT_564468 [Thelephora terrestris]|uniref:Uncharacterized protein n=1 Tax=Thelephora terrestris TaxID=56493 RepID=A0A9P6HPL1_9AGAM|nr:hypothetical protein BJ322DRAFT_564468 [Thelephora terrestris]
MDKLHMLRGTSHDESERLARIIAHLGNLPSHQLSDVVGYNEHNHPTGETLAGEKRRAVILEAENKLKEKHDHLDRNLIALQAKLEDLMKEKQAREVNCGLRPPPADPIEMAVEEAVAAHQTNVQRVVAVENSLQTITSVEGNPHKGGLIQTIEESLPAPDCQSLQLQVFAESIAKLIYQVPVIRQEIASIKVGNDQRKEEEKVHEENVRTLDRYLDASSAKLDALHSRVTELIEGLKHEITTQGNPKGTIPDGGADLCETCEYSKVVRGRWTLSAVGKS